MKEGKKEYMKECFGGVWDGWKKGKLRNDGVAKLGYRIGGLRSPRAPTFED